jgi:hypothetical protein
LLHGMTLLEQCLRLPGATAAERAGWWRDMRQSRVDLAALYVEGLPRDFRKNEAWQGALPPTPEAAGRTKPVFARRR